MNEKLYEKKYNHESIVFLIFVCYPHEKRGKNLGNISYAPGYRHYPHFFTAAFAGFPHKEREKVNLHMTILYDIRQKEWKPSR